MQRQRLKYGGTMALVVVVAVMICLVGIGIFVLSKTIGGDREVMSAVDAGALNVSKLAIVNENVPYATISTLAPAPPPVATPGNIPYNSYILQADEQLLDTSNGGGNAANKGVADLLIYNRLVGRTLLVALNAQADGGPTAVTNAITAIQLLQGPNSIGKMLQSQLKQSTWQQTGFNSVAMSNSLALVDGNRSNGVSWQNASVGYVGENSTDANTTNVQINGTYNGTPISITNLMPYSDFSQSGTQVSFPSNASDNRTGGNYLSGYQPIAVTLGNTTENIYGVPVSAVSQPHLVSINNSFSKSTTQPGNASVAIPPNSFCNSASAAQVNSNLSLASSAASVVGAAPFNNATAVSIPNGYLVIDNSGTGIPNQGALYTGNKLPAPDNVTFQELSSGISAMSTPSGGALFSNNGALEAWTSWLLGGGTGSPPSLNGLYNQSGTQATIQQAEQANGSVVTCNDFDSDGPGAVPICDQLLTSPVATSDSGEQVGAFDWAYYGQNASYGLAQSTTNLTADEYAAVELAGGYATGYNATALNNYYYETQQQYANSGVNPWANGGYNGAYQLNVPAPLNTGMRMFYPNYNAMLGASLPWYSGFNGTGNTSTSAIEGFQGLAYGWAAYGGSLSGSQTQAFTDAPTYSNPLFFGVVTTPGSLTQLIEQNTTGIPSAGGSVANSGVPANSGVYGSPGGYGGYYKISKNGIQTLVSSAPPAGQQPVNEITNFITNRIYQIKPNASATEISNVLNAQIALGGIYYVYLDSASGNIAVSDTPPPQAIAESSTSGSGYVPPVSGTSYLPADGSPVTFFNQYALIQPWVSPYGNVVNAQYYDGADGGLFNNTSGNGVYGKHTVTYTPGTGAYNNLGVVQLQDTAYNSAPNTPTGPVFSSRN